MGVAPFDGPESDARGVPSELSALMDIERHLEDLEQRKRSERVTGIFKVRIRSGNASQRAKRPEIVAICQDISETGCRILSTTPLWVGDVYNIHFELNLPHAFARCVRCRLLREDAFECAFSFFSPLAMPGEQATGPLDLG